MGNSRAAPVIVIGMGRSGTQLGVMLLERLGIEMGVRQDVNRESLIFLKANIALLDRTGVRWYDPVGFSAAVERDGAGLQALARRVMRGRRAMAHIGLRRYLATRDLSRATFRWGWKDPRSTFTLPIWLRLFPQARVIHVKRHGLDVAASLMRRREYLSDWFGRDRASLRGYLRPTLWRGRLVWLPAGRRQWWLNEVSSFDTLESGLAVWDVYMDQAKGQVRRLGDSAIEVSYEEILTSPASLTTRLADFLEVSAPPPGTLEGLIDRGRSEACVASRPAASELAASSVGLLRKHGYEP